MKSGKSFAVLVTSLVMALGMTAVPAQAVSFVDCISVSPASASTNFRGETELRVSVRGTCSSSSAGNSLVFATGRMSYYFTAEQSSFGSFPLNPDGYMPVPANYSTKVLRFNLGVLPAGTYYPKIKFNDPIGYPSRTFSLGTLTIRPSNASSVPSQGGATTPTPELPAPTPTQTPSVEPSPEPSSEAPADASSPSDTVVTNPEAIAEALALKPSPQATYGYPSTGGDIPPEPSAWRAWRKGGKLVVDVWTNAETPLSAEQSTISVYDNISNKPRCSRSFARGETVRKKFRCSWRYPWGRRDYGIYAVATYPGGYIAAPIWNIGPMDKKRR